MIYTGVTQLYKLYTYCDVCALMNCDLGYLGNLSDLFCMSDQILAHIVNDCPRYRFELPQLTPAAEDWLENLTREIWDPEQ